MAYPYHHQKVKDAVQRCCELLLLSALDFGRATGEEQHVVASALNELVWKFSEASPITKSGKKHLRCEKWTKKAAEEWKKNRSVRLIFEHVVPRRKIVTLLLAAQSPEEISAALDLIETCVVLPDEDKKLDRSKTDYGSTKEAWWRRYEGISIGVNPFVEFEAVQTPIESHELDESHRS